MEEKQETIFLLKESYQKTIIMSVLTLLLHRFAALSGYTPVFALIYMMVIKRIANGND